MPNFFSPAPAPDAEARSSRSASSTRSPRSAAGRSIRTRGAAREGGRRHRDGRVVARVRPDQPRPDVSFQLGDDRISRLRLWDRPADREGLGRATSAGFASTRLRGRASEQELFLTPDAGRAPSDALNARRHRGRLRASETSRRGRGGGRREAAAHFELPRRRGARYRWLAVRTSGPASRAASSSPTGSIRAAFGHRDRSRSRRSTAARRASACASARAASGAATVPRRLPLDRTCPGHPRDPARPLSVYAAERRASSSARACTRRPRRRGGTSARCRARTRRGRGRGSAVASRISSVTVMTWQPIASAWTTFRTSRGLAQISSRCGCGARRSSASVMIGIGSRPVSAMRPANTETKPAGPSASQLAASSTWSSGHQRGHVHLDPVSGEPPHDVAPSARLACS